MTETMTNKIKLQTTNENIDWQAVSDVLSHFGLNHYDACTQEKIFKNSYGVVFVYDKDQLVGCGRVLSDGICQAAIYNVALLEQYHGKSLGREMIQSLIEQVEGCTISLYTHPKTVALYEKFGFRRQKTGMVIMGKEAEEIKWLEEEGFLLPKGYRFGDNAYEQITGGISDGKHS